MESKYTSREARIAVLEETQDELLRRLAEGDSSSQDFAALVREFRQLNKELREESVPFDEHKDKVKSPFDRFMEGLADLAGQ